MDGLLCQDVDLIVNTDIHWNAFDGKTVLISGANGYVPQFFVHAFMRHNDLFNTNTRVICLCRNAEKAKERFAEYLVRNDFEIIIQDVCETINIAEPIHFFIHAASPAGVKNSNLKPVDTFCANVYGCENMLRLATKNPCEGFLLLSSVDAYGKNDGKKRFKEDDLGYLETMNPRTVYAQGKRAAEVIGCVYGTQYGVPFFSARPSQIMGPGVGLDDGRLHIDFISQMLKGNEIVLKGDGSPVRSFIYISDAITAMLTILSRGKPLEAYNVASEEDELSVLELAKMMASMNADKNINVVFDEVARKTNPEVINAVSYVCADSTKIRELGWKPNLSVKESCRRMMNHYGINVKGE